MRSLTCLFSDAIFSGAEVCDRADSARRQNPGIETDGVNQARDRYTLKAVTIKTGRAEIERLLFKRTIVAASEISHNS